MVVLTNLFFLNLFFYFTYKNQSLNLKNNLVIINILLILVFFVLKNILAIHPSTNELIFVNLTRIMDLVQYIPDVSGTNEISSLLFDLVLKFTRNIFYVIKNHILTINFYSIIISINIVLIFIFKKTLNNKTILFNVSCIAVSFLILIISSFRSAGSVIMHYYIFSDIFLVLPLCSFSTYLKKKYFILIIFCVLFVSVDASLKNIKKYKSNLSAVCIENSFYAWVPKINKIYFNNYCKKIN